MQSSLMDAIIEPTDFAGESDFGPTAKRKDANKVAPVSLFDSNLALSKENARKTLGLDPVKPAVLVQLGTGAADVNQKMTAALKGLIGWKDCQVVLTKEPKDSSGKSLAPSGLDLKIIRYFPLANLLNAFDGAVSAAGYNGVHELLAAKIPTVLVPNIRGTDDQVRRAKWCQDNGFALFADQSDLNNIESQVRKLQVEQVRNSLANKCQNLSEAKGAKAAAELLLKMANAQKATTQSSINNHLIVKTLFTLTLAFRFLKSLIKTK
jgi:UDP-N-acetylglucosamine:LPS N-acetylglucosamine transferase